MEKKRLRYLWIILIPAGILINVIPARLALYFELPLFLDSLGTVLSAVLGGFLPGIIVGFFSNVINGISDPITLYYSIISVLIAISACLLSRRKMFKGVLRPAAAVLIFTFLGGGLGSVLTWLLYGFSFGTGISAPFAVMLYEGVGLSKFAAQLTADLLIDLVDKAIVVAASCVVMRFLPVRLLDIMPEREYLLSVKCEKKRFRSHSLRTEVVLLIIATSIILGSISMTISFIIYKQTTTDKYISTAVGVTEMMSNIIDADRINSYLTEGPSIENDEDYRLTEGRLYELYESFPDILYMYVYQVHERGCNVVFDLDTPELEGGSVGDTVDIDPEFEDKLYDLIAGREIDPVISNGQYGWLLTVYKPLRDSTGHCVAYAAADISMEDVITDRYIYVAKMTALLFGAAVIIVACALFFAKRRIVDPINQMTEEAEQFAYDSAEERLKAVKRDQIDLHIRTGNELESLSNALIKTAADMARYITDVAQKAETIARMQNGIILTFANMVENRDCNTGEHIKHTAEYVRILTEEMRAEGKHPDIITDGYLESVVQSAPLHDIGKIKISDMILNKPGRLTPEEFENMKTHTTAGRDILLGASDVVGGEAGNYLYYATEMAAYHHERWDGKGYPEGLAGDEIPLCARIMAVADVFDALISKRSYKDAMPFEAACGIIIEESGSHFDPEVVGAFIRTAERFRDVADGR